MKKGLGELELGGKGEVRVDEMGRAETKGKLFSTHQVTAKPVGGMEGMVRIKDGSQS